MKSVYHIDSIARKSWIPRIELNRTENAIKLIAFIHEIRKFYWI